MDPRFCSETDRRVLAAMLRGGSPRPSGQFTRDPYDRRLATTARRWGALMALGVPLTLFFAGAVYAISAIQEAHRSDPCRALCAVGAWPGHPDPCAEERAWLSSLPRCASGSTR